MQPSRSRVWKSLVNSLILHTQLHGDVLPLGWFISPCLFLSISVATQQQLQHLWGNQNHYELQHSGFVLPWIFRGPQPRPLAHLKRHYSIRVSGDVLVNASHRARPGGGGFLSFLPFATKPQDLDNSKLSQAVKVKSCIFHISPLLAINISVISVSLNSPAAGLCCNWPWYI